MHILQRLHCTVCNCVTGKLVTSLTSDGLVVDANYLAGVFVFIIVQTVIFLSLFCFKIYYFMHCSCNFCWREHFNSTPLLWVYDAQPLYLWNECIDVHVLCAVGKGLTPSTSRRLCVQAKWAPGERLPLRYSCASC